MTLSTLPRYLIGRESAIREVIESRGVLLLGFLFVLSAGFAREYDGEDLVAEPWHVLIPLGASVVSCALLYLLLLIVGQRSKDTPLQPLKRFGRFLGLYWMTAPLAWLYAIPVERWLEPVDAMRFNLYLLGIVALWRVLLISRAAAVLFGTSFSRTIFPVLLFGDGLMLFVVHFIPVPIFQVMGGIRLTSTEVVLQNFAFTAGALGWLSLPVWIIGTIVVAARGNSDGREWRVLPLGKPPGKVSPALWGLGIASLLVWIPILPLTQPPLRLKHGVDALLNRGDVEQAVRLMSAHERGDFPPIWDPAPRPAFDELHPPLYLALRATRDPATAPWVRELYVDKVARQFESEYMAVYAWKNLDDEEFYEYLIAINELPPTARAVEQTKHDWRMLLGDKDIDEERQAIMRSQLVEWGWVPMPDDSAEPPHEPPPSDTPPADEAAREEQETTG